VDDSETTESYANTQREISNSKVKSTAKAKEESIDHWPDIK
jgi:hypothetical protein